MGLICVGKIFQHNQYFGEFIKNLTFEMNWFTRRISEVIFVDYEEIIDSINEFEKKYSSIVIAGGIGFFKQHKIPEIVANLLNRNLIENVEVKNHILQKMPNIPQEMLAKACFMPQGSGIFKTEHEALCGFHAGNYICFPFSNYSLKMVQQAIPFITHEDELHHEVFHVREISEKLLKFLAQFEKTHNVEIYPQHQGLFSCEITSKKLEDAERILHQIELLPSDGNIKVF